MLTIRPTILLSIFFVSSFISSAYAFKIKTHVYVGDEVIRSIENCSWLRIGYCFNLKLANGQNMRVPLQRALAKALLDNKEAFLVGHYGPDAFPDMLTGQTVIHPGSSDGMHGTGDWLKMLLAKAETPKEIAFTLGYQGHAAADVFAHSYVNMYAGDVFSLTDGETDVEERHTLIESLIAKYTPESKGSYYDLVMKDGEIDVPLSFVYRTFLQSEEARKFYEHPESVGAKHLLLMENTKQEFERALVRVELSKNFDFSRVVEIAGELKNPPENSWLEFIKNKDPELDNAGFVQLVEVYLVRTLAYYYFSIDLKSGEAQAISDIVSRVNDAVNGAAADVVQTIEHAEAELANFSIDLAKKTLTNVQNLDEKIHSNKILKNALSALETSANKVNRSTVKRTYKLEQKACGFIILNSGREACKRLSKEKRDAALKIFTDVANKRAELVDSSQAVLDANRIVFEIGDKALDEMRGLHDLKVSMKNNVINNVAAWSSSFRKRVEDQVSYIDIANENFFVANAQAMTNSMNTKWWASGTIKDANSSILQPYAEWLFCYGPVSAGSIPVQTGDAVCDIKDKLSDFREEFDSLENILLDVISIDGKTALDLKEWASEEGPIHILDKLQQAFNFWSKQIGINPGGFDIKRHHSGFVFSGQDGAIDEYFDNQSDVAGKKLLRFEGADGITKRIKYDMGFGINDAEQSKKQSFDPEKFAVVSNAIQLAKLTLLTGSELNGLSKKLGYTGSDRLFSIGANENILTNWLRSLDGNQQWLLLSPPYPRSENENDTVWIKAKKAMNEGCDPLTVNYCLARTFSFLPRLRKDSGAIFFLNKEGRDKVFGSLFKGPLTPALFETSKFKNIIPPEYPYKPSTSVPFPAFDPQN